MNSKVYKEASIFYNMKYIYLLFLFLLFIPMLSAQESLGVIKQNECIRLYQTCPSCSYINISSVIYPDKTVANSSLALTTTDNFEYYADFCSTSQLGKYIVNGKGDVDGTDTAFAYDFEVTSSGRPTQTYKLVATIVLFLFFISFVGIFYITTKKINYERWYNSIIQKYEHRNYVKVVISSIGYNLIKNKFIWYYAFILPIILIITDMCYTFDVDNMIEFMKIILMIYYFGIILVGIYFFGFLQEWIVTLIDDIKNLNFGVSR